MAFRNASRVGFVLLLTATLTLIGQPAFTAGNSTEADRYAACLIGYAAIALLRQAEKARDADKAYSFALQQCKPLATALDAGSDDFVYWTIKKIGE